jgi:hypothetical protein
VVGVAVGGAVWQGWRVRFPASEVRFDFFLILLLAFRFLDAICFALLLFSFLSLP